MEIEVAHGCFVLMGLIAILIIDVGGCRFLKLPIERGWLYVCYFMMNDSSSVK